jgi:hypothetical protein
MYRRTVGLVKTAFKSEQPDREAFRQICRRWKRMWKVAERVGELTGSERVRAYGEAARERYELHVGVGEVPAGLFSSVTPVK